MKILAKSLIFALFKLAAASQSLYKRNFKPARVSASWNRLGGKNDKRDLRI